MTPAPTDLDHPTPPMRADALLAALVFRDRYRRHGFLALIEHGARHAEPPIADPVSLMVRTAYAFRAVPMLTALACAWADRLHAEGPT